MAKMVELRKKSKKIFMVECPLSFLILGSITSFLVSVPFDDVSFLENLF